MKLLVGDCGGTYSRLKLLDMSSNLDEDKTLFKKRYENQNYSNLESVIEDFLNQINRNYNACLKPDKACFAIAATVSNNRGKIVLTKSKKTGEAWPEVDGKKLTCHFQIPQVSVINDFDGVGYGIINLWKSNFTNLYTLQHGELKEKTRIAIIGAGTGLGETFLIWQDNDYKVYPTEGGRTTFSSRNDTEYELFKYLKKKFNRPDIAVQDVVSGKGIRNIFEFLRYKKSNSLTNAAIPEAMEIASAALAVKTLNRKHFIHQFSNYYGADAVVLAQEAMKIFVEAYATEAANLALKTLPYNGLYIVGDIAVKNLPLFEKGASFINTFLQKEWEIELLKKIPVHIILNEEVGLIGATYYAKTMM